MKLTQDERISRWVFETTKKSWLLRHAGVFFADDLIWFLIGAVLVGRLVRTGFFDVFWVFLFLVLLFGSWLVTSLIARLVRRERPYKQQGYEPLIKPFIETSSFPSSHATFAFAIFVFSCVAVQPPYFWWVLIGSLLISFGRVMVGVHRLSEIVVGAIIGSGVGYLIHLLLLGLISN